MACIRREIDCLRELEFCDNVVSLESVYKSTDIIQLVLKFAPHGSLLKFIVDKHRQLQEEQVRSIMAQLILTVDLMQRKGIYHRDLKPENILILDKETLLVCIADLGLACRSTDEPELLFKCGTPGYVAPELLKGFGY